MRTLINIAGFLVIVLGTFAFAFACSRHGTPLIANRKSQIANRNILTITELQQALADCNHPRYDPGPIDGIAGPRTIDAWQNWTFDKYANRGFHGLH